jgi:peptidoglycan/xylan/chitin deacetylase (PgdA/CDA1 family)
MIVLNYHRVSERDAGADFYTVTPAAFAAHLGVLAERGSGVVASDEVLDGRAGDRSVMLHFDDGTADHHHTVARLLAEHGFRGVFFISTAKIGNKGYLSESDVRSMAAAGHAIECHGHSHRRMDRMTGEELAGELRRSVEEIHRLTGRCPRILAPPGGFVSKSVVESAARAGMPVVRTMRWNVNPLPLRGWLDCLVVHHGITPATIERWLDGKGLWALKTRYRIKQAIRSALPLDMYLALRRRIVRTSKPTDL